jgi:protein phosphatase
MSPSDKQFMQIIIGIGSDTGLTRAGKANEDLIGTYAEYPQEDAHLEQKGYLFVLADGMGGAAGGSEASKLAVEMALTSYYDDDETDIVPSLLRSIQEANAEIYYLGHHDGNLEGIGTTIVTAVILGNQLVVVNVGDSRAYLLRNHLLQQLSTDHTLVQSLLAGGAITTDESLHHPYRHVLLRNLGHDPDSKPDFHTEILQAGDVILLCNDGLWDAVAEAEIITVLEQKQGNEAARALIDVANEHGGPDNVSMIILHVV